MVLEAARGGDQYVLDDVGVEVDIRAEATPFGLHRILRADSWIRLAAYAEPLCCEATLFPLPITFSVVIRAPAVLITGFDLILFLAVLQSEGDVQRGVEDANVEQPGEIQIEDLVPLLVGACEVFRRHGVFEAEKLRVDGVPYVVRGSVLAERGTHVVVPAVE